MQQDTYGEHSTLQLVVDQIEELIVTLIEEIRERPAVAGALLAAVVGAIIGSALAVRARRPPPIPRRVVRRARLMGDLAELGGLGLRLLENPLVRAVIVRQLLKRLRR
jgi:hypothetical protein